MLLLKLVEDGAQRVRGMVDPADRLQKFSVYDFATMACKYNDSGARRQYFAMTQEGSEYRDEVKLYCLIFVVNASTMYPKYVITDIKS